jgi:hypothetical protein
MRALVELDPALRQRIGAQQIDVEKQDRGAEDADEHGHGQRDRKGHDEQSERLHSAEGLS